jgi:Transcriptional regulator AcaB
MNNNPATSTAYESNDYLNGEVRLILHMRLSHTLLQGNWKTGRIGLFQFATIMERLCHLEKKSDSSVKHHIEKIYQNIGSVHEYMKRLQTHYELKLSSLRGFEIQLFSSANPSKLSLRFATPFAYLAAHQLIAEFDYLLRQAHTLKRIGIMLEDDKLPRTVIPIIRNVFTLPMQWKKTDRASVEKLQHSN